MSTRMSRVWIVIGWLLVSVMVNLAIVAKERHWHAGQLIYLELVPVDPRSLIQGDYMALRFALANDIQHALEGQDGGVLASAADGHAIVALDDRGIARFETLQRGHKQAQDQIVLTYRLREGRVKFATDAFFFQEGHAQRFENARYGAFRVNPAGELLLVGLHDERLQRLGPALAN